MKTSLKNRIVPELALVPMNGIAVHAANKYHGFRRWWDGIDDTFLAFLMAATIVIMVVFGGTFGILKLASQSNARNIAARATLYHYKVGETVSCNVQYIQDTGATSEWWIPCKILSMTKDNRYYTTRFTNYTVHVPETHQFPITNIRGAS